jgi:hypothetical protein
LSKKEGILYADVDPAVIRNTRWNLDVAGHYARPDAFQLTIRTTSDPIINVEHTSPISQVAEIKEDEPIKMEAIDQESLRLEGG